jgi:hypothetical protein
MKRGTMRAHVRSELYVAARDRDRLVSENDLRVRPKTNPSLFQLVRLFSSATLLAAYPTFMIEE